MIGSTMDDTPEVVKFTLNLPCHGCRAKTSATAR
jgi:hypothetical protein